MKWFCISWVVLIVGYMIAAYWWAARAEKRINEQIKRCMDDLEKTVGEHKKALRLLYERADKACQVRQNLIRRLQDEERWIAWSKSHGSSGWNDAEIMTPGKNGDYWVTVNEDRVRTVKVATYMGDWIVGEAEIVEAWKLIIEEPEPYVREEEKG